MEKRIVFFVAVLLLVLLAGCTQQQPPQGNLPSDGNVVHGQDQNASDQNAASATAIDLIVKECAGKASDVQRDLCFRDKAALAKSNLVLCDRLVTLSKDDCINRAAFALKDGNMCDKVLDKNIADTCFALVAKANKDYVLCEKIVFLQNRASCLFDVGKPNNIAQACKEIPTTTTTMAIMRDDCLKAVAVAKKDANLCELLLSATSAGTNRDLCYWEILQPTKDKSICPKISDKVRKDDCFDLVARNYVSPDACQSIVDMNRQYSCIKAVADKNSNAEYCYLILDKVESDNCKNALLSKVSLDVCGSFSDATQRENCYYSFSTNYNADKCQSDVSAGKTGTCIDGCKKITVDANKADACFATVAIKLKDANYCKSIRASNISERNRCFDTIATANLDTSLCANIFNAVSNYSKCFAGIAVKIDANVTDTNSSSAIQICSLATTDFPWETYPSKNWCLYYYAKIRSNKNDCNKIRDVSMQAKCVNEV